MNFRRGSFGVFFSLFPPLDSSVKMSQLQSDPHHSLHYTDHPLPSTERTAGRDDPKFAAVPRRDDPKFPFVDLEESHPKYYQNPNTYIQHEHDALEVGEPRGNGSKSERTVGGIRRRVFWTIIVVASVVVVIVAVAGGIGGYFAGKAKSQRYGTKGLQVMCRV
jgi:hypothetical protein